MELEFSYVNPRELTPYARNARKHPAKQIMMVKASIKEFGFKVPILVRDDMTVVSGHARLQAALELKLDRIPIVKQKDLTPDQARAFVHIDNQLALKSEWDEELLRLELDDINFNFDPFEFELPDFLADDADTEPPPKLDNPEFLIVVMAKDEEQQATLFEEFSKREIECKLM